MANFATARPGQRTVRVVTTTRTAAPTYKVGHAYVDFLDGRPIGRHPVIVRLADGLMLPCTHNADGRGVVELPLNWLRDGDTQKGYAKPNHLGRYQLTARTLADGLQPLAADVVAYADRAFAWRG